MGRVTSVNLVFLSIKIAEVAEWVDATVSKTVEGQLSCRFESDLRHQIRPVSRMPSGVVVAQGTLNPLAQVRILARQPVWKLSAL